MLNKFFDLSTPSPISSFGGTWWWTNSTIPPKNPPPYGTHVLLGNRQSYHYLVRHLLDYVLSRLSLLSREEQIPMNLDNKVEFTVSYSNTYDNCFMHTLCVCISSIDCLIAKKFLTNSYYHSTKLYFEHY